MTDTDIVKILEDREKQQKKTFRDMLIEIFDLISFLVFVWWIVLFIRFFIFNPYTVVWQSMEPTFDEKDFIIVDKISQRIWDFKRWDIVVFVPPGKDVPYIKRIIWVPWDIIKIIDWSVFLCKKDDIGESCKELEEKYLPKWSITKPACNISEFTVTSWWYMVLWDNREHSTDSRCCFGLWCYNWSSYLVPDNYIIWKVYVRIYPNFNKF